MPAIEMQHVTKRFGNILANENVNLCVDSGEIHAIVGENGAGKSTLMNILYGLFSPDSGKILINGKEQKIDSPRKAMSLGLGMVHQHFMLVPPLTVIENIMLGRERLTKFRLLDLTKTHHEVKELCSIHKLKIDLLAKVKTLSVGLQQKVEILKVLYRDANILIFDEPTAVLTPQETEDLFATLRQLKEEQKTIILITHKLNEVMEISDRVTVLRQGKVVGHMETKSTSTTELAHLMVGKEFQQFPERVAHQPTGAILEIENVSALSDKKVPLLQNISLRVSGGEILGIAAVEGNGQTELVQVITGERNPTSGSIRINGSPVRGRYSSIPISHIPEDRLGQGVLLDFSVSENFLLGRQNEKEFSKKGFMDFESIDKFTEKMIRLYDIRPGYPEQKIRWLSGGNQQKVVVGRELSKDANLIIATQPSRGLDIGAMDFVHKALLEERNKGKAILLVSSDLTELLTLSDRIAVLYEGQVAAILNAKETTERELGVYMTGALSNSETAYT